MKTDTFVSLSFPALVLRPSYKAPQVFLKSQDSRVFMGVMSANANAANQRAITTQLKNCTTENRLLVVETGKCEYDHGEVGCEDGSNHKSEKYSFFHPLDAAFDLGALTVFETSD
jgi:uncharacterized protein YgiB involved in biofilm formation